jgi:hypothetical protein
MGSIDQLSGMCSEEGDVDRVVLFAKIILKNRRHWEMLILEIRKRELVFHMVAEKGVHVAEVGDEVVAEEDQLLFNQLSGMGSSVGSTKERVDVVGVGLPLKIVWIK